METDLETRADIEQVLVAFYGKVLQDPVIGHFFTQIVSLNLETHIPVITDFWEAVVFGHRTYSKNVMEVHQHIHQLANIQKEHLNRWVELFTRTIDVQFEGERATLMKQRGQSVATLMDIKLNHNLINKKL